MKNMKLILIGLLLLTITNTAFSQSDKFIPPAISTELDYDDLAFAHETVTRVDSGIMIVKTIVESYSSFNARIITETTFISNAILNKHNVTEVTPLDSVPKMDDMLFYLPTKLNSEWGKPKIEDDKLYFKSDGGKTNKTFIITYANKEKTEIASLKDTDTNLVWEKSKPQEAVVSIGF